MNRKSDNTGLQLRVDAAAEKLLAAGIRPTVSLIHEAIGGSPRGLRPLLEDWRVRLASRKATSGDSTLIPEERAEAVVREAIDSARGTLRKQLRSTRERMSTLSARAAGTENMPRGPLPQLVRELGELQSRMDAHATKLEELHLDMQAMEVRAAKLIRALQLLGSSANGRTRKARHD